MDGADMTTRFAPAFRCPSAFAFSRKKPNPMPMRTASPRDAAWEVRVPEVVDLHVHDANGFRRGAGECAGMEGDETVIKKTPFHYRPLVVEKDPFEQPEGVAP